MSARIFLQGAAARRVPVVPARAFAAGVFLVGAVLAAAGAETAGKAAVRFFSRAPLVFPSYYLDDVAVRIPLAAARGGSGVDIEVILRSGGQVRAQRRLPGKGSAVSLTLPLDGVAPGPYEIVVRARRGGRVLDERRCRLERLRRGRPATGAVWIDRRLRLRVHGQPFFPVGIYETPLTPRTLAEFKQAGFNTVRLTAGPAPVLRALLDRLHAAGLMGWVELGHLMEITDPNGAKAKRLRALVAALRDHPALLLWESVDEPAWGRRDPDALLAGYRIVRRTDPGHPVWMNHAPRNRVPTLARFNLAADISGCDIYPVPEPQTQSDLPNKTLSVVGDEADKDRAAVGYRKPIFMVLQGFAWGRLQHRSGVYPSLSQQRFMAWDAIVHGASGILYWGTPWTPKPSRAWADIKTVANELHAMIPVLLAPPGPDRLTVSPPAAQSGVETLERALGGKRFLVVLNTRKTPAKATIGGLPGSVSVLYRVYGGAATPVRSGTARLELPGYGVVLATTAADSRRRRPDYSEELRSLQPEPPLERMRVPGNLVLNPSFEFVDARDNLPRVWRCRYPLSVFTDPSKPHSGRFCVRFESRYPELRPLLVQTGIPVQPGRRYRLSAWYRTDGGPVQVRIYVEWVVHGQFRSKVSPWTRGMRHWRLLEQEFTPAPPLPAGNRIYTVVQTRGRGTAWFDDVSIAPAAGAREGRGKGKPPAARP